MDDEEAPKKLDEGEILIFWFIAFFFDFLPFMFDFFAWAASQATDLPWFVKWIPYLGQLIYAASTLLGWMMYLAFHSISVIISFMGAIAYYAKMQMSEVPAVRRYTARFFVWALVPELIAPFIPMYSIMTFITIRRVKKEEEEMEKKYNEEQLLPRGKLAEQEDDDEEEEE